MTKDDVAIFVMHANPAQIASIAAFIQGGCKAVAPVDSTRTVPVENELIKYADAAKMLGVSPSTVRRLRVDGDVQIAVVRGREKVVRASVIAYLERVKQSNAPVTPCRVVRAA